MADSLPWFARLFWRRESSEGRERDERCGNPSERTHAYLLGQRSHDEDRDGSEREAAGLIEAAGFAPGSFAVEGAHHASATGDNQLAKQALRNISTDGCPGIEPWAMEGSGHDKTGGDGSRDEPGATLDPEIGDGTPQEIDRGGQDEQRDDLGASAYSDSLLAEKVRQRSLNDAVGEHRRWCNEEAEEPGAFFLGGGIQACGWLQVDFGHGSDVSTTERLSTESLKKKTPRWRGSFRADEN